MKIMLINGSTKKKNKENSSDFTMIQFHDACKKKWICLQEFDDLRRMVWHLNAMIF